MNKCPYPIGEDDGTISQCIEHAHCSCGENDVDPDISIAHLRMCMKNMTPQYRIDLLHAIAVNYCMKCGNDNGGSYCQCDNDE